MELIPLYDAELESQDTIVSEAAFSLLLREGSDTEEQTAELHSRLVKHPTYIAMIELFKRADLQCTDYLILFLMYVCKDSREIPMWGFTLYCIKALDGRDTLYLMHLLEKRFLGVVPKRSDLKRIWKSQKKTVEGKRTNCVEDIRYWKRGLQKLQQRRK